jgi:hypothetical protein
VFHPILFFFLRKLNKKAKPFYSYAKNVKELVKTYFTFNVNNNNKSYLEE